MVGPDLRIRRFTSVADRLFSIIPTDVGRSITDIRTKIDLPTLDKQISEVIDTLQTKEFEMRCHQGHWWSVRIRPYKTTDSKIDGAVIAFVDIEHQKNSRK
jgi:two-component system CheB/CheR fusion protein